LFQILRGGSSYTRFLIREYSKMETPPGGGGSFDQIVGVYNGFVTKFVVRFC